MILLAFCGKILLMCNNVKNLRGLFTRKTSSARVFVGNFYATRSFFERFSWKKTFNEICTRKSLLVIVFSGGNTLGAPKNRPRIQYTSRKKSEMLIYTRIGANKNFGDFFKPPL